MNGTSLQAQEVSKFEPLDHTIDHDGVGGSEAVSLSFPVNRKQLDEYVLRYQLLLRLLKEGREKYEVQMSLLQFHDAEAPEEYIDLHAKERKNLEAVFALVSERYDSFISQEEGIYSYLMESLCHENDKDIDIDLLREQITGLQYLVRDMDLPDSLMKKFMNLQDSADKNIKESGSLAECANDIIEKYFTTSTTGSFLSRAEAVGIDTPKATPKNSPLTAPLGNYYTEQIISGKILSRLHELENVPANLGTFNFESSDSGSVTDDYLKINALVELKALQALAFQKKLKNNFIRKIALTAQYDLPELAANTISLQGRRGHYIRQKVEQPHPHLLSSQLQDKFKLEAAAEKHRLHIREIESIAKFSKDQLQNRIDRNLKKNTLGRFVTNLHLVTEKEESKKLEKTAKQRLQALKANDEEAYIKLLDQTKDHRITHLLKQTNTFLDSLTEAVKVQQAESDDLVDDEQQDTNDELREKIDYYQVAHRIKEEIKEQPKILIGGQLKEYQLKGLQWMVSLYNNKLNGILADEMGLGKTIQSISLVSYLIEKKGEDKFLVIVPLSTITNWTLEFEKWAPSINVVVFKGSPAQRKDLAHEIRIGNFQVVLTTYEYIIKERPLLSKFHYSHMIIDEGHRMKNAQSKLSITLKQYYRTKNRLILTGTPLQNNLPELWALLNFVLPKIFNSVKSFDEWFNTPFANTGTQEKIELSEEESLLVIRRLHKVLRPFLLRRLKKDVEKDLPDKIEKVLKCNLSSLQNVLYQQMMKHNALFVGSKATEQAGKSGIKGLNNKMMQLKKICNHPFIFDDIEPVVNPSGINNELVWRTSGKFELLDRILPKLKASGHRVLIFFQMTTVMTVFEDFLNLRGLKYMRLDGNTKADDRQTMLKDFNKPDSEYFCFLLSTRAGGLGLNLQSADTVIIFDTDWNPHQDLQAQDRAHRIGQKNEVRILRLITNDSVEELILERAHQKLEIDGKVIQAGKFDNKSTAEEQEEFLKRLLDAEQGDRENEESNLLDDDELNEILARSEWERELFSKIDMERVLEEKQIARSGGYSTRLILREELPEEITENIAHHFEKDTTELGRMRDKKRVKYDDGLTEEQWLMAMDDDDDTVEDAVKRKEEKMARRKRRTDSESEEPIVGDYKRRNMADNGDNHELHAPLSDLDDDGDFSDSKTRLIITPDFRDRGMGILAGIDELVAEDGHFVAEIFRKLPSKKEYPDYYMFIKKPVSLFQIRKKLLSDKYKSFDQFIADLQLMCSNAKLYNQEDSFVYIDATTLENFLTVTELSSQ